MTKKIISISSFVDYSQASPQRRQTIMENVITPPVFLLDTKYPDIERATASFLCSKCKDDRRLKDLDRAFFNIKARSEHQENRLLTAHDAIEIVRTINWPLSHEAKLEPASEFPKDLEIEGLSIRIKPSVILKQSKIGSTAPQIGVAKPYFKKSIPLKKGENKERGITFACLLHWYSEEIISHLGVADPKLCFVADIFSEEFHFAAERFKQRRKQIEALSREIVDRWNAMENRLNQPVRRQNNQYRKI